MRDMFEWLLRASEQTLDVYSRGLRKMFPDMASLMSEECLSMLDADFKAHPGAIDSMERLNSTLSLDATRRGPARALVCASRESLLRQAAELHMSRGGQPPLGKCALASGRRPTDLVARHALLPESGLSWAGLEDAAYAHGHESASTDDVGQELSLDHVEAIERPAAARDGILVAAGKAAEEFGQAIVEERPNPSMLGEVVVGKTRQKSGLSVYMLARNKYLQSAKRSLGRKLLPNEVGEICAGFRRLWPGMDQDCYREAYEEWLAAPDRADEGETQQREPYRVVWGGGCASTPFTKEEMHFFVTEFGWPSAQRVQDADNSESRVPPVVDIDFDAQADFDLWGRLRPPRNADRQAYHTPLAFELVEKGVFSFLESLTRPIADAGDTMLLFQGPSTEAPERLVRKVAIISGTCYAPKVFEVAQQRFRDPAHTNIDVLPFPCKVVMESRRCLVTPAYVAFHTQTSDEFIDECLRCMSEIHLLHLEYDALLEADGSIRWSLLRSEKVVGCLWRAGMKTPFRAQRQAAAARPGRADRCARLMRSMLSGEPLDAMAARPHATRRPAPTGAPRDANAIAATGGRLESGFLPRVADAGHAEVGAASDADVASKRRPARQDDMMDCREMDEFLPETSCDEEAAGDGEVLGPKGFDAEASPPGGEIIGEGVDEEVATLVSAGVAEVAEKVGLADDDAEVGHVGTGASSSSSGVVGDLGEPPPLPPPTAAPPTPPMPIDRLSPVSPLGYVYLDNRSIMRIQRGKPKKSITVNCYRHPSCGFLCAEWRIETNRPLFEWLFEVPEGVTREEKKALAAEHTRIGKQRWTGKGSGRSAAAASSSV